MITERGLRYPRLRSDLIIEIQRDGDTLRHLITDPTNGRYWQCGTSLYQLLCLCNGELATTDILTRYTEQTHIPLRPEQLDLALSRFEKQGFLVHDATDSIESQPEQQAKTHRLLNSARFVKRWRLFPTSGVLSSLETTTRWIFSPIFLTLFALLALVAIWILWQGGWNQGILSVMMGLYGKVSLGTWGQFLVALFITMLVHEGAHGLTLQHFGRKPGYFGLAFSPWAGIFCYVEIGEVWRLSSRRQRVAVSLAGPLASLLVGSVGTLVWEFLPLDAMLSSWAAVLIAAGILTAIYNLFPFFRTDGYFALSDWLRLPNLDRKAQRFLMQILSRPFRHQQETEHLSIGQQVFLVGYSILALLIMLWITWVVGGFLWKVVTVVVPRALWGI